MMDSADPLDGWPIPEVFATPTGARDDVNGKLYNYIRSTFIVFHSRLRALDIKFRLFQGDIQAVVPLIDGSTPAQYDRIEVRILHPVRLSETPSPTELEILMFPGV